MTATKPLPPVISRTAAYKAGLRHYFTGKPCKQGHLAQRYVTNGACLECLNPFKLRRHPHRKDLEPYVCPKLWVPTGATPEQYVALETYLQTCIDTFFEHQRKLAAERYNIETAAEVRAEIGGYK